MATASTSVDLPEPFSPTRNVTPLSSVSPSFSSCSTAGTVRGHRPGARSVSAARPT
jgi:hypothetical protein